AAPTARSRRQLPSAETARGSRYHPRDRRARIRPADLVRVSPLGVLYSFKGDPDGALPAAGLILVNGTHYGSTLFGGDAPNCTTGCGTIFEASASGRETVLYSFEGDPDGA